MFDNDGTWNSIIIGVLTIIVIFVLYLLGIAITVFVCGYIILWLLQYFGILQHFGIGMLMGMI